MESVMPDEIEKYPWAGHLGIKLAEKVLPIIQASRTTLIFINTRGMSEQCGTRPCSILRQTWQAPSPCTMAASKWNCAPGWKMRCTKES
jgi:Lhr-like helicase